MNILRAAWLRLKPEPTGVSAAEQLRSAVAGGLAVLFVGWASWYLLGAGPFMVASVGASAVLVFAAPASPFAQPWSVVGGYVVSAASGVLAAHLLPGPGPGLVPATALAAGLAIFGMLALRCLHPPGGAVALFAVLGGEPVRALGWQFVLTPVLANAVLLVVVALLVNNLLPGRHYPRRRIEELERGPDTEADPQDRLGLRRQDLHAALRRYGHLVDVGNEELDEIVEQAERLAFRRSFGELACGDIMSRALVTVRAESTLLEAWRLLRRHRLSSLLVVDSLGRVAGTVGHDDFLRAAKADTISGMRQQLFRLLRLNFARDSSVGSIMRREVLSVAVDAHVAELVTPLSRGTHLAAVVDGDGRLVGVVAQADLIAALYQSNLSHPPDPLASKGEPA
jgi:CBS domain-containing membrane protein